MTACARTASTERRRSCLPLPVPAHLPDLCREVSPANAARARPGSIRASRLFRHSSSSVVQLSTCVTAVMLAVAMFGITRDEDRDLAVLALSFRVGEGMLAALAPIGALGLLWLGTALTGPGALDAAPADALGTFLLKVRSWSTLIGATLFAVGSTFFSWLLLRGRMIPIPLSWLGVVASVLLVVGWIDAEWSISELGSPRHGTEIDPARVRKV